MQKRTCAGPLILAAAGAALTAMLWPALTGRSILAFRDMLHNYGPMRELFWSGAISLWNDRAFGGSSVLADIVAQPFYLGNLVMRAVHAPAWPGISIRLWLHSLFGLCAAYLLFRRKLQPEPSALGATAFALSGFAIANYSNPQWLCAANWAPAVLLAADLWAKEGGLSRACMLALALPQPFLAGDPQLCALIGASAMVLAAARSDRPLRRFAVEGGCIVAAALLIVSPQLVASLRAFPLMARSTGLPRAVREQWSLHPARLAELYVPRLFGPLFEGGFWGGFTVSAPWKRNYVHSIYAGAIGPALVGAALLRRRREARPWLLLSAIALMFALGDHFFHLYGLIGDWFTAMRFFRYPQRMIALLMPAWAALLALGAGEMMSLPPRTRLRLVALAFALGLASLAANALLGEPVQPSVWRSAGQLAAVCAASAAAVLLPQRWALPALSLVLVADLWAANAEMFGMLPRAPFEARSAACTALDAASRGLPRNSFRVFVDQDALAKRSAGGDWGAQRVREYNYGKRNLVEVCGYREAAALTSLDPIDELRLWREVSAGRMLRLMGTRFVITAPGSPDFGGREIAQNEEWGFVLRELPDAAPLLFRPTRVEKVAAAELTSAARARPELLGTAVATVEVDPLPHRPDAAAVLVSAEDRGDALQFRVRQAEAGYWVIAATLDGDWIARIDGQPAILARSDLARRAVWVPAGEHTVTANYAPLLPLSLLLLSCALTMALAVLALRPFVARSPLARTLGEVAVRIAGR